jgi:ABC-type amino acid transport substrate-binding protein
LLAATTLVLCIPPVATGSPSTAAPPSPPAASSASVRRFEVEAKPWTGDFDGMLERRVIRVLVPYSRSLYFNERGNERGVSAEGVRGFERWLNEKHAKELRNRPITVVIVPTTRDRLLEGVASGLADLAVGNITSPTSGGSSSTSSRTRMLRR